MPNLGTHSEIAECVFFLFKSEQDALAGVRFGGTGFLVVVMDDELGKYGVCGQYLVTAHHNVTGGSTFARFNSLNGKTVVVEVPPEDWYFIASSNDVAVAPIQFDEELTIRPLEIERWVPSSVDPSSWKIGAGEDVFMVGRFVDYDSGSLNEPALRFGHISVLSARVKRTTSTYDGPCVIVDMHSRTGYSGSPVFVYLTTGGSFGSIEPGRIRLLGLHFAQFPEAWEIREGSRIPAPAAAVEQRGRFVDGLSGMTLVEPAESIMHVLSLPELVSMRARGALELKHKFELEGYPPTIEELLQQEQ